MIQINWQYSTSRT